MYRKVVVCTDLSLESNNLVSCARGLRVLGVQEVILAHVVDVFNVPGTRSAALESADDMFARQIDALEDSGIQVRVEALMGHPAFSVREVCRQHDASLIMIGAHGAGVFGLPFSGSVSSDLIVLSDAPILAVSSSFLSEDDGCSLDDVLSHIFYATDFSEAAQRAFETLLTLTDVGARRITLMHVQDKQRIEREAARGRQGVREEYDRTDAVRLGRLKDRLLDAGASSVEIDLAYGSPQELIAERVASGAYSLAVLGARGRTERPNEALGGVSNEALRHARTPMLIVPHAAVNLD